MNISSALKHLPASTSQEQLHAAIDEACANDEVDGVLVQLPLPPHLNEFDVMERLDPRKDVDGFHPLNMGRMLARNAPPRFVPATALGCMQLLKMYNISVTVRCMQVLCHGPVGIVWIMSWGSCRAQVSRSHLPLAGIKPKMGTSVHDLLCIHCRRFFHVMWMILSAAAEEACGGRR